MSRLKKIYRSGMTGLLTFVFLFMTAFASIAATGSISLTMINGNITFNVYQIGTLAYANGRWEMTKNAEFDRISFSLDDLDETNGINEKRAKAIEIAQYIEDNQSIAAYRTETSSAAGRITFSTMDEGVYLIVKSDATEQNVLMDPFFVTVPTRSEDNTHYVWDINAEPKSESNIGYINIKKISQSGSRPLAGAEFELSYRKDGTDDSWTPYGMTLITAGAEGMVSIPLLPEHWMYEYRLVETKAPSGYSRSRVGTITFTLHEDGTIDTERFSHTGGTEGYVEVSADRTTIIAKNHTTGGGGDPGTPTTPTSPTTPGGPGSSGDSGSSTTINEDQTPLGNLINMIEDAVPLAGLVRTGDFGITAAALLFVMLIAGSGMGVLIYRRKKKEA